MEKRFVVTQCRFHAVDRTKLIISGWMGVEETDSVGIKVMLDKEPLEYHIEKKINTGIAMMEMEEGRTRPKCNTSGGLEEEKRTATDYKGFCG